MKQYLEWSLHQLFLLYFQPTRYEREVVEEHPTWKTRILYMLRILPFILAVGVLSNLLCGHLYQMYGGHYIWPESWFGVGFGVGVGVGFGVGFGVGVGVGFGVGWSVVGGVVLGVAGGVAGGVVLGMVSGVAGGGVLDVTRGVTRGVVWGVAGGVVWGVVLGVARGVAFGVAGGVVFWSIYFRLCNYPVDIGMSAVAWRLRQTDTRRAWQLSPIFWNEVIWLPLPYMGRLLALLAQEDREEGLRQIAFVVAERPLQRRVALAALEEVVLSDLKVDVPAAMERAPDRLQWVGDVSASLPELFGRVRPRFERVALDVGQYRSMNNAFRKAEALQRAVQEIEGIQTFLIGERSRFATRLLQTANCWRDLLAAEQKAWKAQIAAVQEIPNPFVFGGPVPESERKSFVGRQDVVVQIERSILGGVHAPTLLLHGPRRMGKTSILNQLPRLLGNDFAPVTMDCQNPAVRESPATILRYLSRRLSDGLRRRNVTIEPLTASALAQEPYSAFDDWLDAVEKAMPPTMRALLCLDEYERLQEIVEAGWGATFLDTLRHTLQHRPRIVLMFTGARTFAEMGPVWTDRFISARRVKVSFLSPDDVRPLLTQPIPEFDMTYAEGALERLLHQTNGQPFLTQAVAYELVEYMNRQQRKQATWEDVEASITAAFASGGEYFANVWSDEGADEQTVLRAVARGETIPDYPKAITRLQDHDLLTAEGVFSVPMMERWLRENH